MNERLFPANKHDLLAALARRIGDRAGVRGVELANELDVPERRLRHLVEELRREGYGICGHPGTGYFMASTAEELEATRLFLYDRAMTTLAQVAAMGKVALPDLRGQLRLPT